jgi:hypothetical protein
MISMSYDMIRGACPRFGQYISMDLYEVWRTPTTAGSLLPLPSGMTRLFVNGTNPPAPSGTAPSESPQKKKSITAWAWLLWP